MNKTVGVTPVFGVSAATGDKVEIKTRKGKQLLAVKSVFPKRSIAIAWCNGELTTLHRELRGRPSLVAKWALDIERTQSRAQAQRFLAYVAGNPSLFDK